MSGDAAAAAPRGCAEALACAYDVALLDLDGVVYIGRSAVAGAADALAKAKVAGLQQRLLHDHILVYRLDGALFFGAAQRFLTELTAITDVKVVVLRLPDLQVLDATGAQALGEIVAELEARHITVLIKRPRPEHLRTLRAVGGLDRLAHQRHLFHHLDDALEHARLHVQRALPQAEPHRT